jgi:hypothetical protein
MDAQTIPVIIVQNVHVITVKQNKKRIVFEMFKRHDVTLMSNPTCSNSVEVTAGDFQYYDKDGFELNRAEQKYYRAMGHPINYPVLNHTCWQEPWFELENKQQGLILDHCVFLCRCNYAGYALEQLMALKKTVPTADYLIRSRIKWGYDFALDSVRDGETFEVLHVEYDHTDFSQFSNRMIQFDWIVRHTDWHDAADRIWAQRDKWQHLVGFEQNHWKAKYLLNWSKSEYTEKTI